MESNHPAEPQPVPVLPAEPRPAGRRPRRRGRAALLIAAAAVLGVIAGTCTGYAVQADREPTALPPLTLPEIRKEPGKAPEPLSEAEDRKVRTEGDLRKLLVKQPRGTTSMARARWIGVGDAVADYAEPRNAFINLLGGEFRRSVGVAWREPVHNSAVGVTLTQFRTEQGLAAREEFEAADGFAADDYKSPSGSIKGSGNGVVYVGDSPETFQGVRLYTAVAIAWRGDLYMRIEFVGQRKIDKKRAIALAEQQWGRL